MPVLVIFVLATYGFGLAAHHVSSVSYALEDTARTLLLNPALTQSQLQTVLNGKLAPLGNTTVSLTKSLAKGVGDSDIAVLTVTYNFTIKVPFITTYSGSFSRSTNVFLTVPPV
jgi:Flp pilus assembly protein TadG